LRVSFRTLIGPPFGPRLQRGVVALLSPLMPGVGGVLSERHTLGGVPTQVLSPQRDGMGTAVLYLHGGAFCLGGPRSHRSITTRLARDGGFTVHVPDYRLAPEHPHPAPLEDALAAYEGLLQQGWPAQRIVLAGDSAGGALALSLAQALKQGGQPLPAAMLLISPVVDTTLATAKAAAPHVRDPMLRMGWLQQGLRWHGAPPSAPSVDDLAGLPPLLLQVGDQELLLADAELLARRAQAAGVACTLEVYQGRWHVSHLQAAYLASARAALQTMIGFARAHGQARPANSPLAGGASETTAKLVRTQITP